MNKITVLGDTDGGKFGVYNIDALNDFCKKNQNKRIIIEVFVEEKESKNAKLAYYYKKIVPDVVNALFDRGDVVTEKYVDRILRGISPITQEKTLSDLSNNGISSYPGPASWKNPALPLSLSGKKTGCLLRPPRRAP